MDTNTRESPPTVDISKKRRRRLIYLAVAAVLWWVIAHVLFGEFTGEAFVYGEKPGIYWLECHKNIGVKVAIFAPIITTALLLLIPGFLMNQYDNQLFTAFILAVLVLGVYTLLGPSLGQLRHVQTVRYGGHTYYLADRVPIDSVRRLPSACMVLDAKPNCKELEFSHEYLVYQCGKPGVICQNIGYQVFEERLYSSQGELSVDAEGSIILMVDGKWFWTYPTGEQ